MKRLSPLLLLFISLALYCCSGNPKVKVIRFNPLTENDFNFAADSTYLIPKGKMWEERKKLHDSCMGSEFPANAMFIRTKDTFWLGAVLNKKTMKVVRQWDIRRFLSNRSIQTLNVITRPCYERMPITTSVDSFFNGKIIVNVTGADEKINNELNKVIHNAVSYGIETGSWLNAELNDALGRVLDTTTDAELIGYKKALLDPDNIVLIRSANITNISMYLQHKQPLSKKLQNLLRSKPFATVENANFRAQLFLLDESSFEIVFTGIFQVMGQFMRCELR